MPVDASTRPFIGITCSADDAGAPVIRPWYVRAVHAAGGLPVALPFVESTAEAEDLLGRLSGLVLTGSEDLDSALWSEPLHPAATVMHPARHATELAVCRTLLRYRLPVLAICGGMQTLNVVAGGTVAQHIPDLPGSHLEHSDTSLERRHRVETVPGCRLAAHLGRRFETNTHHHQAVGRLADGFVAAASAEDGIVEAYESPGWSGLMAVQWHPERMPETQSHGALFEALVADARHQDAPRSALRAADVTGA